MPYKVFVMDLSLLFRGRAEMEANMPIYGSVFHEAIPVPSPTAQPCAAASLALPLGSSPPCPLWEPSGQTGPEDIREEIGVLFSCPFFLESFFFSFLDGDVCVFKACLFPFCNALNPKQVNLILMAPLCNSKTGYPSDSPGKPSTL